MNLVCSYCGARGTESEWPGGRCGKCGSFSTELESSAADTSQATLMPEEDFNVTRPAENTAPTQQSDPKSTVAASGPQVHPTKRRAKENEQSPSSVTASEELVRPRRLSPQYQKRVENAWRSTLAGQGGPGSPGYSGPEQTISSRTTSDTLRQTDSWLSIGTRRITPKRESGSGDYVLNEVIGEGNMGRVWSARQTSLDRNVALKLPKPELANAGSLGESQFISEVVVTGKLEHPNIVPIYELGRDAQGLPFYSMKHVQGRPWNEVMGEKSEHENLDILMKVCDAIAFAHDRHFLHRDIKPQNVMVGEFGEVAVMDWGIAVSVVQDDPDRPWAATATGPAGTPAYMAPEMAAHNPSELGIVSDVYLLGAVLYEIITGYPPHPQASNAAEALIAAASNEIVPTEKQGELVDIARRAMATNVHDRYQSVKELQEALRGYRAHRESIALADSAAEHLTWARESGNSDEFARARFAYEEAIKLWSGNERARKGFQTATLAYANNALRQENYALGLSILDKNNPAHQNLYAQLEKRQRLRRRRDFVNRVLVYSIIGMGVVLALGATAAALYYYDQKQKERELREDAVAAKDEAEKAKEQEEAAARAARAANEIAQQQKDLALKQEEAAVAARKEAEIQKLQALEARTAAEEASYRSQIGLAAESLRRNAFDKARDIMEELDAESKAAFRHWEWAYQKYLLEESSLRELPGLQSGEMVEAVAVGEQVQLGKVFAAGSNRGIRVWTQRSDDASRTFRQLDTLVDGFEVTALDITPDAQVIVAGIRTPVSEVTPGGTSETSPEYLLNVWRVQGGELVEVGVLSDQVALVHSLDISSDGDRVLVGTADGKAVIWDLERRQPIPNFEFKDHTGPVWNAQFSPDDSRIVTACGDGRVRVWDLSGGQIADFRRHQGPVYTAAFVGNQSVVSGGEDRRLLQWRLTMDSSQFAEYRTKAVQTAIRGAVDPEEVYESREIGRHDASIRCVRVARDATFIVSCSHDNSLKIWPGPTSNVDSKTLRGHGRWVRACAISPDGQQLISGGYDGAKLWDWRDYEIPEVLSAGFATQLGGGAVEPTPTEVMFATYSPDSRWIACALRDGAVAVWDMQRPDRVSVQRLANGHRFLTTSAEFFAAGTGLLTSGGDDSTRLWDVARSIQLQEFSGTGWRGAATISADGRLLLTGANEISSSMPARLFSHSDGQWLELPWSTPTSGIDNQQKSPAEATAVALAAGGRIGFVGDSEGRCYILDIDLVEKGVLVKQQFEGHASAINAACFVPDTEQILTAGDDGVVRQWDADTGELLRELAVGGSLRCLTLSQNGRTALLSSIPRLAADLPRPWNIPVIQVLDAQRLTVTQTAALELEEIARQRDTSSGQVVTSPPVVQSVAFSPNEDSALITVYYPQGRPKQSIFRWKLNSSSRPSRLVARWSDTSAALFRPQLNEQDEGQLLTVGGKGALLWKVQEENQVAPTPVGVFRPEPELLEAAFSPDSKRLVTAARDGTAAIWKLVDDRWEPEQKLTGEHGSALASVSFDPVVSDRLLTASKEENGQDAKLVIWQVVDAATGWQPVHRLTAAGQLRCAHFSPVQSPRGAVIMAGLEDGVLLWDLEAIVAGETDPAVALAGFPVHTAAFSAEGQWLATAGDSTAQIWNFASLEQPTLELSGHSAEVTSLAFSGDGRRLLTGSADSLIKLWDTNSLQSPDRAPRVHELLTLEEHQDQVTAVGFSPDGRNVLTCSKDGRAIIWAGEAVPPSVRVDRQVRLEEQPAVYIARRAVVQAPTQADFSQASLTVAVRSHNHSADATHGQLILVDQQEWERLGWRVSTFGDRLRLKAAEGTDSTAADFQRLLRAVIYKKTQPADGEQPVVSTETNIKLEIILDGVSHFEWDQVQRQLIRVEFPPVRAECEVEIEMSGRQLASEV